MNVTATPPRKVDISARSWMAIAFVVVFAYMDWITHRELATTIILAGAAIGFIVFRRQLLEKLNLTEQAESIPSRVKPVLAAIPGIFYFFARGQGTSDSGSVVFLSMVGVIAASVFLGPRLDVALASFYERRNRMLPRGVRMALAIVVPILIAFLVVHGSLADLPALFGGSTNHPSSPVGLSDRFLFATLLSAAVSWLLLREAPPEGAAAPTAAAPAVAAPSWWPTHTTPAGGMSAWDALGTGAPPIQLDGDLPVAVVSWSGEWAQVAASNGWTGWVDGRLLQPIGGGA